jgi:hypothetical protein
MADAFTPNYNLVQPQVGGDVGTWGGILNSGVMGALDNILGATYSTSITSADVTLTTTQFQNGAFLLNGALTGNHNLILPYQTGTTTNAVGGKFLVINNTSGGFTVTVKTAAANATSTVAVAPQGQVAALYSDTVNVGYIQTGNPATVPAVSGNPSGQLAGSAGTSNVNASLAWDYTNGALYVCILGTTVATATVWSNVAGQQGFDAARNLSFTTSVAANVLTVTALAASTNTTPAPGAGITIPFRDVTIANGDPVLVTATSTTAISTIVGASLGAPSGSLAFRLWIVAFNNAGSVVLGLINCSGTTGAGIPSEASLQSSTAMSPGATNTATFYTPSAITVTSKAWRILGYLDYGSGLVTAGTYNTPPTTVQLFGPGIKKPGDVVQTVTNVTTTQGTASTTSFAPLTNGQTLVLTPTSAPNLVRVFSQSQLALSAAAGNVGAIQVARGTTLIGIPLVYVNASETPASILAWDVPGTTAALTYGFQGKISNSGGQQTIFWPYVVSGGGQTTEVSEIMS